MRKKVTYIVGGVVIRRVPLRQSKATLRKGPEENIIGLTFFPFICDIVVT